MTLCIVVILVFLTGPINTFTFSHKEIIFDTFHITRFSFNLLNLIFLSS